MFILIKLADNKHSGCSEVVGADSQKGGRHHIQGLPKKIRFADTYSSVGERIGGRGDWFQWY